MRVFVILAVCCVTPAAAVGCGSGSDSGSVKEAQQSAARQARIAAARLEARSLRREARRVEARERHQAELRQAKRQAARQRAREAARQVEAEERQEAEAEESEEAEASCDPNYSGACLDPNAYDYDCEGGSGDGPEYTGSVAVVGEDHYGLDSDGDGSACEY